MSGSREREVTRAREREEAARAGAEAAKITSQIDGLRETNEDNEKEQGKLASPMAAATRDYQQALADKAARDNRIEAVTCG